MDCRGDEGRGVGRGCDGGSRKRKKVGAGGLAYKGGNGGDPCWMKMEGKIEMDLGYEEGTDMRCRQNVVERRGLALADA